MSCMQSNYGDRVGSWARSNVAFVKAISTLAIVEETNQHEDKDNTKYLKRGADVFEKIGKHGSLFLLPFLTK